MEKKDILKQLKELENLELKDVNVQITDVNNNFTSTTLDGALDELFQSANNGKNTIATSIGSPLLATDTFNAMGTKIDTLTDTFKSTLTSKGVEVVAEDKVSTLITKVGDIELGGKFASGVLHNAPCTSLLTGSHTITTGFKPRVIFLKYAVSGTLTLRSYFSLGENTSDYRFWGCSTTIQGGGSPPTFLVDGFIISNSAFPMPYYGNITYDKLDIEWEAYE